MLPPAQRSPQPAASRRRSRWFRPPRAGETLSVSTFATVRSDCERRVVGVFWLKTTMDWLMLIAAVGVTCLLIGVTDRDVEHRLRNWLHR